MSLSHQHRRGRSTGSMSRDEDLALFHQMKAHERNNFLHPNTDDIEASLRYRIVAPSSPLGPTKANDLLGLEPDKSDYDWLLTPPQTPLFPSLEDAPKQQFEAPTLRPTARTRPSRAARGSGSPSPRTASPSSSTGSLNRRASFGNSSPARPTGSTSRPVTPTGSRPLTPGRTTPPSRRSPTSNSPTVSSTSTTKTTYVNNNGTTARRTARSSSPSSKPRPSFVHPAVTAEYSDAPPNLRTSVSDRPASAIRGASVSPRPDSGAAATRRAVSPSLSRSFSSSSSKSPVHKSFHRADSSGKRPMSGHEETSPVKPVTKKPVRLTGSNSFSATSSQRKSPDTTPGSVRQMDFRRNSSSGFRPLMSNSHITSFYNRASNSLQNNRPVQLTITTDSSLNSSMSATSIRESDHEEDEVLSRSIADEAESTKPDDASVAFGWRPGGAEDELMMQLDKADETLGTPTSSDAFYSTDFHEEDMEIDECQSSPVSKRVEDGEYVRELLNLVIDAAVELAEKSHAVLHVKAAEPPRQPPQQLDQTRGEPVEAVEQRTEVFYMEGVEHVQLMHEEERRSSEAPGVNHEEKVEPCSVEATTTARFTELFDPKYSSSSLEVYQFDQELHSTGSEVGVPAVQDSPSTSRFKDQTPALIPEKRHPSSSTSAPASSPPPAPSTQAPSSSTPASSAPASSTPAIESTSSGHQKAEVHVGRASSRSCKPAIRDPPFSKQFNTHLSRKRESRESSLFSIQINSSKGESISSGRPASTDDTHSSIDTPRRFHDCNGDNASSYSSYKAYDEYDTKSEESCVDYYIDSMESKKYVEVEKAVNREHMERLPSLTRRSSSSPGLPKDFRHHSFDTDEDGFVDYYIDDFSSRHGKSVKASADMSGELLEAEKCFGPEKQPENNAMETEAPAVEERTLFMEEDDTHIEVCSMDSDTGETVRALQAGTSPAPPATPPAAQDEETDTMTECWKQLGEMDCDGEEDKQQPEASSTGAEMIKSSSETREAILICSSIVHDMAYKAASLGMEKEDLKALATPSSTDELVTFIGLSKHTGSSGPVEQDATALRWRSEELTVRRTVAYLQNQKTSQNTTVGFLQQNPVEEDVKDHIIPEHHFIDHSADVSQDMKTKRKSRCTGCKCTIM